MDSAKSSILSALNLFPTNAVQWEGEHYATVRINGFTCQLYLNFTRELSICIRPDEVIRSGAPEYLLDSDLYDLTDPSNLTFVEGLSKEISILLTQLANNTILRGTVRGRSAFAFRTDTDAKLVFKARLGTTIINYDSMQSLVDSGRLKTAH